MPMTWPNSMVCPMKHWPRSSSDLPQRAYCCRTTGLSGGYTLARDPRHISVFDVIKASEGPRRSGIHDEHWRHLKSVTGYHALCKVSQVVEDMLRELTIENIEEKASSPAGLSRDASSVRASQLHDQTARSSLRPESIKQGY